MPLACARENYFHFVPLPPKKKRYQWGFTTAHAEENQTQPATQFAAHFSRAFCRGRARGRLAQGAAEGAAGREGPSRRRTGFMGAADAGGVKRDEDDACVAEDDTEWAV